MRRNCEIRGVEAARPLADVPAPADAGAAAASARPVSSAPVIVALVGAAVAAGLGADPEEWGDAFVADVIARRLERAQRHVEPPPTIASSLRALDPASGSQQTRPAGPVTEPAPAIDFDFDDYDQ